MTTSTSFASLLERFFTQRLMQQRQASPHTRAGSGFFRQADKWNDCYIFPR
jgi:hypothetical protein